MTRKLRARASVILFGTGGYFSTQVLKHLCSCHLQPIALVLPEYPPVHLPKSQQFKIENEPINNSFVSEAEVLSVPLIYGPRANVPKLVEHIAKFRADYILVACWPYLLSSELIKLARKAALNIHPSLLPKYRGVDPVSEQIVLQEKTLGVSLHLLNESFDCGDIIAQITLDKTVNRPDREYIECQAAKSGVKLFSEAVDHFSSSAWRPRKQTSLFPRED